MLDGLTFRGATILGCKRCVTFAALTGRSLGLAANLTLSNAWALRMDARVAVALPGLADLVTGLVCCESASRRIGLTDRLRALAGRRGGCLCEGALGRLDGPLVLLDEGSLRGGRRKLAAGGWSVLPCFVLEEDCAGGTERFFTLALAGRFILEEGCGGGTERPFTLALAGRFTLEEGCGCVEGTERPLRLALAGRFFGFFSSLWATSRNKLSSQAPEVL